MDECQERHPELDRADLLVGRYFRLFGAIEAELNEAIRKLFELPPNSAGTVCANIDFFKKLNIVRSALTDQDADGTHKEKIKTLFGRLAATNDNRSLAGHTNFEANGTDGVVFNRIIAKTGLQRTPTIWTENGCLKMFTEMEAIRKELHVIAQSIAPYHPSLDFSDPRNGMYIAVL
jgi:hypothetical protein